MSKFTLSLVLFLLLLGCVRRPDLPPGNTDSLAGLKAMSNTKSAKTNKGKVSRIREMALKEIALSLGAQSGLAWRASQIDLELEKKARILDSVYDFNALVLEHNVLPPVLLEGRNTLNLADAQSIRVSDRSYKVAKQARFISTPPNWRQYIWMDYKKPEYPNQTLLPKTRQERRIWCNYVTRGWNQGIEQANIILEENIARIKEDLTGMILYRKLLAMNMVSPPYVSHTNLGVTGDEAEMHIDDRVLRITALPRLNVHSDEWRAAVAKDERALEQLDTMEKRLQHAKLGINANTWQPMISPSD